MILGLLSVVWFIDMFCMDRDKEAELKCAARQIYYAWGIPITIILGEMR